MNNQKNNAAPERRREEERRMLPFFVEFVKFSTGFVAIIAIALFFLNAASAAMP